MRRITRYRGFVLKIVDCDYPSFPHEWRLVRGAEIVNSPTSYGSLRSALRYARDAADSILEHRSRCRR